jgi:hypothetical protein
MYVARLQIAVNDSLIVCRLKSVGDLSRQGERLLNGKSSTIQALIKRLAFNQLENQVFRTVDFLRS